MNILITGASGLVGKALVAFLIAEGHRVGQVVRTGFPDEHRIVWDFESPAPVSRFEGWDVVIHLAGESLSRGIWTKQKRKKILESRSLGTKRLVALLDGLDHPPRVFLSASAVGVYGDREGPLTEESSLGRGFLADVCKEWEAAASGFRKHRPRIVLCRFGYILSRAGGMLKTLRSLFLWGLGGAIGGGRQFVPWISLNDVVRALDLLIRSEGLQGPVNVVSPRPVRQREFARILAKVLKRPCLFSVPRWMIPGKKAKDLMLPSLEVYPKKLVDSGFVFTHGDLQTALLDLLHQ